MWKIDAATTAGIDRDNHGAMKDLDRGHCSEGKTCSACAPMTGAGRRGTRLTRRTYDPAPVNAHTTAGRHRLTDDRRTSPYERGKKWP